MKPISLFLFSASSAPALLLHNNYCSWLMLSPGGPLDLQIANEMVDPCLGPSAALEGQPAPCRMLFPPQNLLPHLTTSWYLNSTSSNYFPPRAVGFHLNRQLEVVKA